MTSVTKPLSFIAILLLSTLAGCEQKAPASDAAAPASASTQPKRMHPSWDKDGNGINDCETDGSCDHTIDYTLPRPEVPE